MAKTFLEIIVVVVGYPTPSVGWGYGGRPLFLESDFQAVSQNLGGADNMLGIENKSHLYFTPTAKL